MYCDEYLCKQLVSYSFLINNWYNLTKFDKELMEQTTIVPHGLVEMTNEEYHAGDGISKSKLDTLNISPLAFWDAYINPDREPQEYKHCFAVGDGSHKLVLEPGTFEQTYAVGFDKSKYPNALNTIDDLKQALTAKKEMVSGAKPELIRRLLEADPNAQILAVLEAQYNATLGNKIVIPADDYKNMLASLKRINSDRFANSLLTGASVEQSFFWTDDQGVLRKCRTDAINAQHGIVIDLKTTDDVSKSGFGKTIAQRRYHVQAAWYLDILKALYGSDAPRHFAFIAAQKKRPHDVAVHYLTDEQIELGRQLYRANLGTYVACRDSNYYPGAAFGQIIEAELPAWEMNKLGAY